MKANHCARRTRWRPTTRAPRHGSISRKDNNRRCTLLVPAANLLGAGEAAGVGRKDELVLEALTPQARRREPPRARQRLCITTNLRVAIRFRGRWRPAFRGGAAAASAVAATAATAVTPTAACAARPSASASATERCPAEGCPAEGDDGADPSHAQAEVDVLQYRQRAYAPHGLQDLIARTHNTQEKKPRHAGSRSQREVPLQTKP